VSFQGSITRQDGVSSHIAQSCCLTVVPDSNLWIRGNASLWIFHPNGEVVRSLALPKNHDFSSLAVDAAGAAWFLTGARAKNDGPESAAIVPVTHDETSEFPIPADSSIRLDGPLGATAVLGTPSVVNDANGVIWFIDHNAIGRLTIE